MKLDFLKEKIIYNVPDAVITYYPSFFKNDEADKIYKELLEKTIWQQDEITVFGKTYLNPD